MATLVSCQGCMGVVDLDNAPSRESSHGTTLKTPSFKQHDITCPHCGGLLQRKIDGEEIFANEADPRGVVAMPVVDVTPPMRKVPVPPTKAKPKAKGKA